MVAPLFFAEMGFSVYEFFFFLRRFLLLSAGSTWRMIKRVGSIVICAVCVPLIWAVMERPLEANGLFDNVGQGNG